MFQLFRNHIFPYWKSIIVMSVPLLLLPLPVISGTKVNSFALCNFRNGQTWWLYWWICQEASCGYIILIMAIYWMTEALPLPITSLIPVVAFPLFGILDTGTVCMAYMKVIYAIFISFLCVNFAVDKRTWHLYLIWIKIESIIVKHNYDVFSASQNLHRKQTWCSLEDSSLL